MWQIITVKLLKGHCINSHCQRKRPLNTSQYLIKRYFRIYVLDLLRLDYRFERTNHIKQ